jgi:AcrR family transcriptional regulator
VSEIGRTQGALREACLCEAMRIIADVGIEDLSLRQVARRLGVSHQAPYRHFPSRDHLLAQVVDRCFRTFAAHLAQAGETDDPMADLERMGRLYLEFSRERPLEYRLMFGAKLPNPHDHPEMLERGSGAFDQLRRCLCRIIGLPEDSPQVDLEAMLVWSTIHGLASILETDAICHKGIDTLTEQQVTDHVLGRIKAMLRPA